MRTVKPTVREKIFRSKVAGGLRPGVMPREKIRSRMPPGNRYATSSPKAAPMSAPTMRMTMKAAAPPGFLASVLPSSCRERFRFHAAGSMDAVMKTGPTQG